MSKDVEFFRARLPEFKEAEEKFFSGQMNAKEYKGISGKYGSYAQKGGKLGMIRLRMCGGHMTKDKLSFIIDECERYGIGRIHTTTCETVQLHNLTGDQIYEIMDRALDHGINTQGGGGDNPRNVSATSLSGVEPGERFDVYPYAKETETYLLDIMTEIKLPRKLKVTFSSSDRNETHATFRDLGFIANDDGTFDVWAAGGLGNNPRIGIRVAEGIDPSKTLYYVRAMVDTFMKHGNYENRSRARTRYMREDLGDDGFLRAYGEALVPLLERGGMDIHPVSTSFPEKEARDVSGDRIFRQKQPGLYYVAYHPVGGDVPLDALRRIRDAIADIWDAEVRVAPDSTLYIINLSGDEAIRVRDATEGGARTLFETSVSCIGSTICQQGLRDSNGTLYAMIDAVREAGIPDNALPRFRISGCVSSCGNHQVGMLGLQGASKTVDGKPVPVFNLTVNGCGLEGKERFGDAVGAVLVDRCPDMAVFLGRTVAATGKDFDAWLSTDGKDLAGVLRDYLI